ncbi:MAG TPA: LPS assembly protein LptD [Xanthomonadales bacterium]|nr:LPS assembly protein LptD [Xanthomonadales bacterium]
MTTACLLASSTVFAQQDEPGTEPRAEVCPDPAMAPMSVNTPERAQSPIIMYAESMDAGKLGFSEASGDVEITRADQTLQSDLLQYQPDNQRVIMPGAMRYSDAQLWVEAQQAEYSFTSEAGSFVDIDYGLSQSSANGSADSLEIVSGQRTTVTGLNFTTCPGERPDWEILAEKMELNHDQGYATARNARLKFKGVPILYAPWFTFPIDDRRKSGFLYPSFSNTNDNGFEFSIPYYWNIRPNMDATLEPRYFTDRGFMLTGLYRFLTKRTSGYVDFDYMPDDKESNDERYSYLFEHRINLPGAWGTQLQIERVSDDQYFQDFGEGLVETSRQFLRSAGTLQGYGHYWSFETLVDDFQVIDDSVSPENEPYRRQPRIEFLLDRPFGATGFGWILNSDLTYFDRDVGVTGARADLATHLYWERWASWGFIRPSVGYRYTSYELDDTLPGQDTSPDRGTSILSVDGGLFFDRTLASGNSQTLEPRIFYLNVPYEQQSELPDFDTGEFTFGFSQLFNTNRFAGGDRQGDANQLSVSLSTRTYDGLDGDQIWALSIGQIFYFEDQRVQLNNRPEGTENQSPFIAEFSLRAFRRFSATAGLQWEWDDAQVDVASLGVSYYGKYGERAAFEYRFRRDRVDQFDFRFSWPINQKWTVISRVNYSFEDDDLLETQAGFQYESCCWAIRTIYRRYLKNRNGEDRDGIYLELNLKGLASVGTGGQKLFPY